MNKTFNITYYLDFESRPREWRVIAISAEEAVGKLCWRERGKAVRVDLVDLV